MKTMYSRYETLLEEGERLREQNGNLEEAMNCFIEVIKGTLLLGDTLHTQAIAQVVLTKIEMYKISGDRVHLFDALRFAKDALIDLQDDEHIEHIAVIKMRIAQIYLLQNNLGQAYDWSLDAIKDIESSLVGDSQVMGEIYYHHSDILLRKEDFKSCVESLRFAKKCIQQSPRLRGWHRRILLAGIYSRLLKVRLREFKLSFLWWGFMTLFTSLYLAVIDRKTMRLRQLLRGVKNIFRE